MMRLSPGRLATLACLLEVSAPKPGNVHRGADFEDVSFDQFTTSAVVLGQVLDEPREFTLGQRILRSVEQTQAAVGTNTNLGIILLLSPLVQAAWRLESQGAPDRPLEPADVVAELRRLTPEDGQLVFEATRLANPGGMGSSSDLDVHSTHGGVDLLAAMKLAADRDSIAAQYALGFEDVFTTGQSLLAAGRRRWRRLPEAIVEAHVAWLAQQGDTLIARKCGDQVSHEAQRRATLAMECLQDEMDDDRIAAYHQRLGDLDFWMRSDGHRRNPGTTADLLAATLWVALYNRTLPWPLETAFPAP